MPRWRALVPPLTTLALWLVLTPVTALSQPLAAANALTPLREIQDATDRLLLGQTEIAEATRHRIRESERLAAQIAAEEQTLRSADIQPGMLQTARQERDAVRSRIRTLEGQIAHRQAALARLQQRVTALERTLTDTPVRDLDDLSQHTTLRLLTDQIAALRALLDSFTELVTADRRFEILSEQRLRLLQRRIRLDAIDYATTPEHDPRIPLLEASVSQFLGETARLAAALVAIEENDPATRPQRDLLETRLHDAATRAYLRQNDLDLLGLRGQLEGLIALRGDRSAPLPLLAAAADELTAVRDELRGLVSELVGERQVIEARRTLLRERGVTAGPTWDLTQDLEDLIDLQQQDIKAELQRVESERIHFAQQMAAVYTDALTERLPLPGAAGEWQRIAAGFAALPTLAMHEHRTLATNLQGRIDLLTPGEWINLLGGTLAVIALTLGLRHWLRRHHLESGRRLAIPAQALVPALPWAIPALVWAWIAFSLDLPVNAWRPRLLVLGVWPASAFLLRLARLELFVPDQSTSQLAERTVFYRRLRWALALTLVISILYSLTHALPVSPLAADLLDRLALFGLLLLAVPAFGLRGLILQLARVPDQTADQSPGADTATPHRHGLRLLAWLSRMAAVALAAAGLLGLLGYLNLAWAIAAYLGWLALIAALLYLALGALDDLHTTALRRFERWSDKKRDTRGDLWRREFLGPTHALAVLLAWLAAGWGLVRLWGWSAQTPPLSTVLDWTHRALLHVGKVQLTPRDLAIAALLVLASVWIGAWVKRVSFHLAYARIRDHGLRQTLATFTQYLIICAGLLVALQSIGVDLTTLLVFAASLGVGIGFGLQNIVNNFISGIMLLVERPLRIGDIVTVSGHEGEVTRIGFRSLTIRTFDKQEVFVPNGSVITGEFINWTRSDDILRTVLTVGISYQNDPDQAITLVREILAGYPPILRSPAPLVTLWEFGESAVTLRLEYCIHYLGQIGRTAVRSEVNRRIWYGFRTAGISIPYPQRDLHLCLDPGDAVLPAPAPAPGSDAPGTMAP